MRNYACIHTTVCVQPYGCSATSLVRCNRPPFSLVLTPTYHLLCAAYHRHRSRGPRMPHGAAAGQGPTPSA